MYHIPRARARHIVANTLAAIGFLTLLIGGMVLAALGLRSIPELASGLNRFGNAAVYLGTYLNQSAGTVLEVIPDSVSTSTPFIAGEVVATSTPALFTPPKPVPGTKTTGVFKSGTTTPPTLSGLPDLSVRITKVGYLATTSAESFIASSTVPANSRPAISFNVKNIGTNKTDAWRFTVSVPTEPPFVYQSQPQISLNPGESVDYTLGFDQASAGTSEKITVIVNFDGAIKESSTDNNTASTTVTILGS